MTTIAVIPARYGATRFPGKPLANQTGKFLIQHVWDRVVSAAGIDRVVIATDDQKILDAVKSFGGEAQMTLPDHPSGTDRVGEVAAALSLDSDDLVLNVQGDEPEIESESLTALIQEMTGPGVSHGIGTLAAPFQANGPKHGPGSPLDPNCVKVVLDSEGRALYFSRSAIPFPRSTGGVVDDPSHWLLHMGIYAFRVKTLRQITAKGAERGCLEQRESLEQLRWLEQGYAIGVTKVQRASVGIDTPEDYAAFVERNREPSGTGMR